MKCLYRVAFELVPYFSSLKKHREMGLVKLSAVGVESRLPVLKKVKFNDPSSQS